MPLLVAATVISACSGAGDTAADTRTSAPSENVHDQRNNEGDAAG